ncbi:caspase family protein [Kutzneria sp. CA-103260]|uniref:caspase family protein n=1 Tax=Kutzneria sp. CA-103260 TaxID=2802641 RepID=UPI001BA5FCB4|nr:caspase family protein [Kutzneria sp. CA-103260]QUQ64293.1 hypothetical protein JJ691_20130 [Kutzneria sp. CA-103260]
MHDVDFSHSQAVLLGAAHYTNGLPDMPAAQQSLHAVRSTLIGPRCGWPSSRVTVFEDPADHRTPHITWLLSEATDAVVFYYAGHGVFLEGGRLGLALADKVLRFDDLRPALRARAVLVILDCCFSDVGEFADITELADQVERATRSDDAVTLAFSLASREAVYDDRADGLTYFTKAVVETVHHGLPGIGATLSVADIHRAAADQLAGLDLAAGALRPDPVQLDGKPAGQLAFASNAPSPLPEHREGPKPPVARRDELLAIFETHAPQRVSVTANLLLAVAAGVFGWDACALAVSRSWEWALMGIMLFGMTLGEIHVPWWGRAALTDEGLVLHRGPGLAARVRAPWSGIAAVLWRDVAVERVVIGRLPQGRTRVTLHMSPETAAKVWESVPFKGYAHYRYGFGQARYRDMGVSWPLGDVDTPVEDVATAFRASLPEDAAIVAVPDDVPAPAYPRPRVWAAVISILFFGGVATLLALLG